MAHTFTWRIVEMSCYAKHGSHENVVFEVLWECRCQHRQIPDAMHTHRQKTEIPFSPNTALTPYSDLTEEQVVGWVKAVLGNQVVFDLECALTAEVDALAAPFVSSPPLPWATA